MKTINLNQRMTATSPYQPSEDLTYIRVIGFGAETADAIRRLNALNYYGVKATLADPACTVCPTDFDRMTVLLAPRQTEMFHSVAESFYRAGVLTVAILTEPGRYPGEFMDSYTVAHSTDFFTIVKALLDPICMQGYINLDFNDLNPILAHRGRFIVTEVASVGEGRMHDALAMLTTQLGPEACDAMERIAIVLHFSSNSDMKMSEVSQLNNFLSLLPRQTDAIWGVYPDRDMKSGTIRLALIASGKNLIKTV